MRHKGQKKKKRTLSPAQLAALAKGRATMAARRKTRKPDKKLTVRRKRGNLRHMAKRRRGRRSSHSIVRHSAPKSRARHALRAVGGIAAAEKHRTGAFIVAAGLGLAKKQGYTIPHLETVGEAGSLALSAYAARKFLKSIRRGSTTPSRRRASSPSLTPSRRGLSPSSRRRRRTRRRATISTAPTTSNHASASAL